MPGPDSTANEYGLRLRRRMQWVFWLFGFAPKPAKAPTFTQTDTVVSDTEIRGMLVFDEDEDPDKVLAETGRFQTCAGYWQRETDGRWRWWEDVEWTHHV